MIILIYLLMSHTNSQDSVQRKSWKTQTVKAVFVYMAWWSLKINVAIHHGEDSIEQRPSSRQSLPG